MSDVIHKHNYKRARDWELPFGKMVAMECHGCRTVKWVPAKAAAEKA